MSRFCLGEVFGNECLRCEFKEVCLRDIHIFFIKNELVSFFYKKTRLDPLRFNNMIYLTLDEYVYRYGAKYIGNFSKASISGDLYFGVNDKGIIEGIPFYGNIDIKHIKKMFINYMNNSRGVRINNETQELEYDNSIVESYYSALDINIIELQLPKTNTLEFSKKHYSQITELIKLEEKNQKIINMWKKFHYLNSEWQQKLNKYAGKLLNYLINDELKNELIKYIIRDFEINKSYDISNLKPIIDFFSKDPSYYVNLTFSVDYIEEIIKNPYSPIKWLISYKDSMLTEIKKQKPVQPVVKPEHNLYLRYCNNISNINTYLLLSSPEIKFFLVKINIKHIPKTYLEYRYNKLKPWVSRKRIDNQSGPSCI